MCLHFRLHFTLSVPARHDRLSRTRRNFFFQDRLIRLSLPILLSLLFLFLVATGKYESCKHQTRFATAYLVFLPLGVARDVIAFLFVKCTIQ